LLFWSALSRFFGTTSGCAQLVRAGGALTGSLLRNGADIAMAVIFVAAAHHGLVAGLRPQHRRPALRSAVRGTHCVGRAFSQLMTLPRLGRERPKLPPPQVWGGGGGVSSRRRVDVRRARSAALGGAGMELAKQWWLVAPPSWRSSKPEASSRRRSRGPSSRSAPPQKARRAPRRSQPQGTAGEAVL